MADAPESTPTVSVIVIYFNNGPFLADAIQSVRRQTFTDWELLLVDDGSTDQGPAIARAAANGDPQRIRCLAHPNRENRGMSATRNLGIEWARGKYLAFVDGDDAWLPDRLAHHVELLDRFPDCRLVCGPTRVWFRWTGLESAPSEDVPSDPLRQLGLPTDTPIEAPAYLIAILDETAKSPATCSVTIHTRAVKAVGGFDASFRGMFEDQVFFAKLLMHSPVVATNRCLDLYRQHPNSACYTARLHGHYHGTTANPDQRAFVDRLAELLESATDPAPRLVAAVERWQTRFRHPFRTKIRDTFRDPRRALRMSLRRLSSWLLPRAAYHRVWAKAQGFGPDHGLPRPPDS